MMLYLVNYGQSRCKWVANELLMMLRTERKQSREVSLYDPIGTDKEGNEISLLDIIESSEMDIVDKVELNNNVKKLYECVNQVLTPREKEIINMRYGLYNGRAITQREIAGQLDISRSYVSRIEKKALEKLKECF